MDTSFWCGGLEALGIIVEPEQYPHQLLLAGSASDGLTESVAGASG